MPRNDWVKARCIWESVKILSKLINPQAGLDKLSVKIGVPILIVSEPSECCRMIIAIVICPEAVPVGRNGEGFDEVDFLGDFLEELSCKNVPIAIAIGLS